MRPWSWFEQAARLLRTRVGNVAVAGEASACVEERGLHEWRRLVADDERVAVGCAYVVEVDVCVPQADSDRNSQ